MSEATITSKGQVTIPKPVRDALGVEAGDRIDFVDTDKGFLIVPVKRDLKALRGMFKGRRKKPATIEEINAAIAEMGGEK
jgi:antitoxin PrlF